MLKQQTEFEVLVNGKPLKEYSHEGKTFIEGREGTNFAIRMRNNTGSRKLFIPSIDGLSVMNGEKAGFDSSGYIVKPYSAVTIEGWRVSNNEVNEFFFSKAKDAYATKTKNGDNLGVIGCAVFGEKERPAPIIIKEYIPYPQHHCHSNYNLSASNTSSNTSSKEQVNAREQLEAIGVDFRKETVYVTPQAFPGQYCRPPAKD